MSNAKASERLAWAVEMLAVRPEDNILEIGCGQGVAVSLVGQQLAGGRLLAIDRSAKMIEMAERRNSQLVASGRVAFQTIALHEADFGQARFDKIFGIRVGVFLRGEPARELEVVRHSLADGGSFYLFYDPFEAHQASGLIETVSAKLENHRFTITDVLTRDTASTTLVGLVSKPHSTSSTTRLYKS